MDEGIVSAFKDAMSLLAEEKGLSSADLDALAKRVASEAIVVRDEVKRFLFVRMRKGRPVQTLHFNTVGAVGVIVSFVAGVLAGATPVALGMAVIGALLALAGTKTPVTESEAALFWVLRSIGRPASRAELEREYLVACQADTRVSAAAFDTALEGLIKMGPVAETHGVYKVRETLIRLGRVR